MSVPTGLVSFRAPVGALIGALFFAACVLFGATGAAAQPEDADEAMELTLRAEGGETVVVMQDLFAVLDRLFPDFVGQWDPTSQIMRVRAGGHTVDLLGRTAYIVVDQEARQVRRSIFVRRGSVMVPADTVERVFQALGVDFELDGQGEDTAAAPAAVQTPVPVSPAEEEDEGVSSDVLDLILGGGEDRVASPTVVSTPAVVELPASETVGTMPSARLPGEEVALLPEQGGGETAMTPASPDALAATFGTTATAPATLDPAAGDGSQDATMEAAAPASVDDDPRVVTAAAPVAPTPPPHDVLNQPMHPPQQLSGERALSWGQLADTNHRSPPRKLTIVCDKPLERACRLAREKMTLSLNLDISLLVSEVARRDQDALITRLWATGPDLALDVVAQPIAPADMAASGFHVWVVHEALWPEDQQLSGDGDPGTSTAYRTHQTQSLALGSLLRTELARQFPARQVWYDLAPSYLLRRVDAPAAMITIPTDPAAMQADEVEPPSTPVEEGDEVDDDERLARALFAAVATYVEGMRRVQF